MKAPLDEHHEVKPKGLKSNQIKKVGINSSADKEV
jgi:hypothetical protein